MYALLETITACPIALHSHPRLYFFFSFNKDAGKEKIKNVLSFVFPEENTSKTFLAFSLKAKFSSIQNAY